jgi:hypothetical protein
MLIMQVHPDSSRTSRLWSHVTTLVIPQCPMVMTRSCDGAHSNMWVPILPSIKQMAPTTPSTKGSGATIGVLYPGYRGTLVMPQPHNMTRDTPGLACPGPSSTGYSDGQYPIKYPSLRGLTSPGKAPPRTVVMGQDSTWQDWLQVVMGQDIAWQERLQEP